MASHEVKGFRRSPGCTTRPSAASAGFTLTEVLVALIITVIAVLGLAHTFGIGRGLIDRYATAREAAGVAQRRIEWLQMEYRADPSCADLDPGLTHPQNAVVLDGRVPGNETWSVIWVGDPDAAIGGGTKQDYKKVTVKVSWRQAGVDDQVELTTLFSAP